MSLKYYKFNYNTYYQFATYRCADACVRMVEKVAESSAGSSPALLSAIGVIGMTRGWTTGGSRLGAQPPAEGR